MLAGLTPPTSGEMRLFGRERRAGDRELLGCIGYLDQDRPLYRGFSVGEMLRFGRETNARWDDVRARQHLSDLGIALSARVGKLSGGQQAQVALTLSLAKRPPLLLLDEPVAALDPVAREDLMHVLLQTVVDDGITVVLSSHAIADLAAVCDYVIILAASRVQLADDLEHVLATHRLLIGSTEIPWDAPRDATVVTSTATGRHVSILMRSEHSVTDWTQEVVEPTLDEVVLAYLRRDAPSGRASHASVSAGGRNREAVP
jgi:ABC-2 type transport system ATP-binding protein